MQKNVIKGRPAAKKPRKNTPDSDSDSSDEEAGRKKTARKAKASAKSKRRTWEKEQLQEELDELTTDDEAPKERKKRAPISADKLIDREARYDASQWELLQSLLKERPRKPRNWKTYSKDQKEEWKEARKLIDVANKIIRKDFDHRYKIRKGVRDKKWEKRGDKPETDEEQEQDSDDSQKDQLASDSDQEEAERAPKAGPSKPKPKPQKKRRHEEIEQEDVKPDIKPDISKLADAAEQRAREAEKRARKEHGGQEWACGGCTLWVSFVFRSLPLLGSPLRRALTFSLPPSRLQNLWNDPRCAACDGSQDSATEWRKYAIDGEGYMVLG